MSSDFSGTDLAALDAYHAVIDAVVEFHAREDALAGCLDRCRDFAVGQAYAAFTASLAGATGRANERADLARRVRGITRRERQLVEILLLSVDGHDLRAAGLAAEHVREFPADANALVVVERWFEDRRGHQEALDVAAS